MANDIGVKMGVTGTQNFKQAMTVAAQNVKTLDAALKQNEKQLQATGDKEAYMTQKSKLLREQIAQQTSVVKQGQQALQQMEKNGVEPASAAYQKMQQQVLNAQTALLGMQTDLSAVGQSAGETAQQTDKLANSLNSINKKVSFDAVLNGIGKITTGMEAAARKVSALATDVWNTMAAAATWADNENTLAAMYGIDVEELQKMQGASRIIDTSVETIIKSRQKLKQNMASDSQEIADAFKTLGVSIGYVTGKGNEIQNFRDWEEVFWDVGAALLAYEDDIKRDVLAQQIFGKSWMELMPLFKTGPEEYNRLMEEQSVVSQENVDKLNELDDALQNLDQRFQALKANILSELAPAFTELANGFSGLVEQFNEYLQTDEGKEKLQALGDAVARLFEGITDVDFSHALEVAGGFLDGITDALNWIKDNWSGVVTGIQAIGGAFLALKAAEIVGTLAQGANALKQLLGKGGGAAAAGGGSAVGSAVGAGIGSVVKFVGGKVLPVVAGTTLGLSIGNAVEGRGFTPIAHTEDDALFDKYGNVTEMGRRQGITANTIDQALAMGQPTTWGDIYALQEAKKAAHAKPPTRSQSKKVTQVSGEFTQWLEEHEKEEAEIQRNLSDYIAGLDTSNISDIGELSDEALAALAQRIFDLGLSSGFAHDFESLDDLYRALKNEERDQAAGEEHPDWRSMSAEDMMAYYKQIASVTGPDWMSAEEYAELRAAANLAYQAARKEEEAVEVPVEPELPENTADILQSQMEGVAITVPVIPLIDDGEEDVDFESHANGLPFVPFDGYIAALHKGERVVPASQNRSYTQNSNLYVDKMVMNNGTDVNGLAGAIAERNRRVMAGFGG